MKIRSKIKSLEDCTYTHVYMYVYMYVLMIMLLLVHCSHQSIWLTTIAYARGIKLQLQPQSTQTSTMTIDGAVRGFGNGIFCIFWYHFESILNLLQLDRERLALNEVEVMIFLCAPFSPSVFFAFYPSVMTSKQTQDSQRQRHDNRARREQKAVRRTDKMNSVNVCGQNNTTSNSVSL